MQGGTKHTPIKALLVNGTGTDMLNTKALEGKTKRKFITQKMVLSLIDVAKNNGDYDMVQPYWNTYHCQNKMFSSNYKLYGKYCKNRFCTVCCAIRKADFINTYYPTLSKWEDLHFVTLTVKAVRKHSLEKWINGMYKAFDLIKEHCKKDIKEVKE